MVLSSQAPRPDSPVPYVSIYRLRRRRRNRLLGLVVVLLLLVSAAVYALWPTGDAKPKETVQRPAEPRRDIPGAVAIDKGSSPAPPRPSQAVPERSQPAKARVAAPDRATAPEARPPAPTGGDPQVMRALADAQSLLDAGKLVQARDRLNRSYVGQKLTATDAAGLREAIAKINEVLIFSPRIIEGDPHARPYTVEPGDFLSTIAAPTDVPWQFLARINNLDPTRMRAGARIKLVQGPFHTVVDKSDYRMDLYLGDPTRPGSMFVRSFTVGHGEGDSTPVGRFIVKRGKTENPDWKNPRTGEYYAANDPKNPIGERWIGLRGLEGPTAATQGYGIHGTIDPGSIGRQASMGCVRMGDDDIAWVYDMLTEEKSTVTIVP